jgi:hypothetical protein
MLSRGLPGFDVSPDCVVDLACSEAFHAADNAGLLSLDPPREFE